MKLKTANQSKRLKEVLRLKLKESHATEMLGFALDSVHSGRAVLRLDVRRRHKQLHGVVHGGILAAMADTAAAIAPIRYCRKGRSWPRWNSASITWRQCREAGGRPTRASCAWGETSLWRNSKFEPKKVSPLQNRCPPSARPSAL